MIKKRYQTRCGEICYWISKDYNPDRLTLLFLPGLTADHRLFTKQISYFKDMYNVWTWDAPGHNESRPFELDFTLKDKAVWLDEILELEKIEKPLLIGQSMGGYVGQMHEELFPGRLGGFVSIDSAPLQRSYVTSAEIWMLKHVEPVYRCYPWKALKRDGSKGCATTKYGQQVMYEMMSAYEPREYARLTGHGFRMLAEAMEADLPYEITCPALLICGEKDRAGSARNYNKRWTKETGLPIAWIKDAGHNSNTDKPEEVNKIIENFIKGLK